MNKLKRLAHLADKMLGMDVVFRNIDNEDTTNEYLVAYILFRNKGGEEDIFQANCLKDWDMAWEVVYFFEDGGESIDSPPFTNEGKLCEAASLDDIVLAIAKANLERDAAGHLTALEEELNFKLEKAPSKEECIGLLQELTETNNINDAGLSDIANDILRRHDEAESVRN